MPFSQSPTLPTTTHTPSEVVTQQGGAPALTHANVTDATNVPVMASVTPAKSTTIRQSDVQVASTGGVQVFSHTAPIKR